MAVSRPFISPAMLSISSATNVTSSVMVSSVRIRSLIFSITRSSTLLAFRYRPLLHAPAPSRNRLEQT